MKKKIILGVLAICLCVALISCSDESLDKLGSIMGKMGNNVYGITPDMKEVAAVTSTITNSVSTNEAGDIEIDLDSASVIIQKLAEIGTSEQKISQTKEDLKKPITIEGKASADIQKALQDKLKEVAKALPTTEETATIENKKVQSAVAEVKNALTTITESIPEEPTQADLATVVIINSLATEVQELSKTEIDTSDTSAMVTLVDKALSALDALKVTTEAAELDVLGDFNLTSLLSSSSSEASQEGKAVSKDGEEGSSENTDYVAYVKLLKKTFAKIATLISTNENGVYKFDKVKYQRFILQMTALRSTYEVASLGLLPSFGNLTINDANYKTLRYNKDETANVFPNLDEALKNLFTINSQDDLTMNDFTLYFLAFLTTEMDKSFNAVFGTEKNSAAAVFEQFVLDNEENLKQTTIEDLDVSAFDLTVVENIDHDKALEIANKTIITTRTALVISFEALGSESLFYNLMSNVGLTRDAKFGQWLSTIIGDFIRAIDPLEEGETL